MPTNAITAEGLVKIYKSRKSEVRALDGVDLEVAEGTVLGLLGPERRRQDDHGQDPGDPPPAGRRDGQRSPASTWSSRRTSSDRSSASPASSPPSTRT